MLLRENEAGGVVRRQPCGVRGIRRSEGETPRFELDTDAGPVAAPRLVIATGGLPVPAIGATDFGLKVAQQFGLGVIAPRPALVPLTFDAQAWAPFAALSGIALPAGISCGTGHEVDSDLVPVEIEIDPFIRSTAFAAAKHASIKVPRKRGGRKETEAASKIIAA